MSKQRIYQYAKELNLKSKEIIDELKSMNVEVSNHMQALEDDQIKALDKKFKPGQSNETQKNTQNNHNKSENKQQSNQNKIIINQIIKTSRIITTKVNNKVIKTTITIRRIIKITKQQK